MPSSYNNNLRLEMIATGEQSGTWGQTTNTNLGTLIVDAITGKTAVTTGVSPYTLTALNGTADESRAAALELNTSTGANYVVIVPTVTKLYVVENVNGTYSVEVKTASGTGVTVPPLKTVLLRCDGTNVVEQLDQVVGNFGVGGNFSVAGNATFTTQSPGDNTTKAATTAFVTNAVTTATGSLGTMSTQNANNVNITGGTMSGMTSIADTVGNVRNLPVQNKTTSYVLVAADNGQVISITTGGVTVPSGVFSVGQAVSIYNDSASTQTITQGSGATLTQAATGTTGNRSLARNGLCTVLCVASNSFVITGAGLT
jgi:hypothetical protein